MNFHCHIIITSVVDILENNLHKIKVIVKLKLLVFIPKLPRF